jgi:hemerythrin-like metal-binding protein
MSEALVPAELLTGITEMDGQHEHLFDEMHQVKEAFLAVEADHGAALRLMSRLADDLDAHFAWEEAAARASGIPFENHTREHAKIAAFVRAKINEISSGECNIPALMVFMERCFETHVLHHDLKLGRDLLPAEALE